MAKAPLIRINRLAFSGREHDAAELAFPAALSFVYGASNTGKSFATKAIDFMLGGSRELPNIVERRPYNRVVLNMCFGLQK